MSTCTHTIYQTCHVQKEGRSVEGWTDLVWPITIYVIDMPKKSCIHARTTRLLCAVLYPANKSYQKLELNNMTFQTRTISCAGCVCDASVEDKRHAMVRPHGYSH